MNLSRSVMNCQLICRILFLWLLGFHDIFGCISTRYMRKDTQIPNKPMEVPILSSTLENIISNNPDNESSIISAFQRFLAESYNWKIKLIDLNFLWDTLKEFSIKNGYSSRECTFRKPKRKTRKRISPNVSILNVEDINIFLKKEDKRSNIKGASSSEKGMHRAIIKEDIYFSKFEKVRALRSASNFEQYACKLRNETFCLREFLKIKKHNIDDLSQSLPPALLLKRCPNKCSCLNPHEDCFPTSLENRTEFIYTQDYDGNQSTLMLVLVDHIGCKCRNRCHNKECISYFGVVHSDTGSCHCECISGYEKTCEKILEGHHKFTSTDYNCIVGGRCITPNCVAGKLSEEHLYLGHCPVRYY